MKIQLEIDEKELYFMNVPERFKNFVIKNYDYAGLWLMETDSKELNHWKDSLPSGYKYEILGFVNDVIVGEVNNYTGKNFVIRRVSVLPQTKEAISAKNNDNGLELEDSPSSLEDSLLVFVTSNVKMENIEMEVLKTDDYIRTPEHHDLVTHHDLVEHHDTDLAEHHDSVEHHDSAEEIEPF